ncbi:MAG: glycosyltransferase [Bacteroidales bacterium]|jgi:glycosyltransferase involved in cell wall biosynthesis|nr:glycosyltransferase [Bacteroidales bacterium]
MEKSVLAILSSVAFYGKERSNIEVYNLLNDEDISLSIIINKKADEQLKKYTSSFRTYQSNFPKRNRSRFRLLGFALDMLISNISLLRILFKVKPHVLLMNSEIDFYNLYPVLLFFRRKILYRVGDVPAVNGLSFRRYNAFVWKYYICKRVSVCVCISNYIKNLMIENGRINQHDVVIYNYPPVRLESGPDETWKYTNEKATMKFAYLGQITQSKGVGFLIEAALEIFKINDDLLFYIAGSLEYDKEFSQKLQERIPDHYENRIIFLREITNISLFFENIDVLIVPSLYEEALGNVIVEAKQYAKPCIIFPTGGMPELITHQRDGFICDSRTIESLISGMKYYLDNPGIHIQHGCNAFKSISLLGIDYNHFKKKWKEVFM